MTARLSGATAAQQAELELLRDRADQTGREAAQTLAELAARVADARDPLVVARRLAARTRRGMTHAIARVQGNITGFRGAKNAALAAPPVLGALALAAVAHRRGWLPSRKET